MKVALTATYAWPEVRRGGERYLHEAAAALAARGHNVRVLATSPNPARTEQLGVPVELLQRRRSGARLFGRHAPQVLFGWDARHWLRNDRPDVWHALTIGDGVAATTLGSGTRSVHTVLGPGVAVAATPLVRRLQDHAIKHVDACLVLSEAVQRAIRGTHGRDAHVVGGGVDLARFVPARRRESRPTILFASDVDQRWKNADLLLQASSLVAQRWPELQVWMLGPGDVQALLRRHPSVADRVTIGRFATPQELHDRYGQAWVTALPSHGEAFGLAALESLASGTPAVALDGEGPADFLDASVGELTQPDRESLARSLERVLQLSQVDGIVEACRARAAEHDWVTSVAPRLEAIYEAAQVPDRVPGD